MKPASTPMSSLPAPCPDSHLRSWRRSRRWELCGYGVGLDSVDLEAAARLGKWVVSTPGHGTETVAIHTLTLILAGLRRLLEADRAKRSGEWGFTHLRPLHLPGALTIGIVGFGRIGRRVAELSLGVGFAGVLAYDPFAPVDAPGVEPSALSELVTASDVISIHAPGVEGDAPLFDAEMMVTFKPGSILVNCARGSLIDSGALAAALASGAPALAVMDVFPQEPADLTPFTGVLDRMIMTPHMAWYAEESEVAIRRDAAEQARRILSGQRPDHVATMPDEPAPAADPTSEQSRRT